MYIIENKFSDGKELLKQPLFEKYELRSAIVKTTNIMFPFMLFAALFAFIILQLGNFFPNLQDGLYWVSYMSIQFFGIGVSVVFSYCAEGFFSALAAGVLSIYFGVFCKQVGGIAVIEGSSVIGFIGYLVIALLCVTLTKFLHRVCIVFVEWLFGLIFGSIYRKTTDEKKLEKTLENLRPQLENMVFLGDSLVVTGIVAFVVFFIIQYFYALPMTLLADFVANSFKNTGNMILSGAIIGFSLGFDVGGPVSLAVFREIFSGLLSGNAVCIQQMTVFSAAMITPSWICMAYFILGKKLHPQWPLVFYDENILNTGFINEVFQNVRLMAMSPMVYALREPETVLPSYIFGTTVTGVIAALFGISNQALYTKYASSYGLLRTSTTVFAPNYDAFAGLMPPLYASGGAKVIFLSFVSAFCGTVVGLAVLLFNKRLKYSRQTKRGEDLFMAFGYDFTKEEYNKKYSQKSNLEKKLGLKFKSK
jgi:fructose-specific phosphotransferase system IIC component